jgi:aminoglycoside/choline kinase family phosphotransferase
MIREQVLDIWLNQVFKTSDFTRIPLAGDASFRRYYRVFVEGRSYVVMDAPPPETPQIFMEIAQTLAMQGVTVPLVIAFELEQGFLLLSDLGDRLYLSELNEQSADKLYADAFEALLKLQGCQVNFPAFDQLFLERQFGIFQEWFLNRHLQLSLTASLENILDPIYQQLSEIILLQPQVSVHRDYHSRNLMVLEHGNPGVLDFQDAMRGPITYDLVSLLQDCYIEWPRERVVEWVKFFQHRAKDQQLLNDQVSESEFLHWFDWTGLQRHLKNLGIFARLNYRDGKARYLKDIPRVLYYIKETCARYSALNALQIFFETIEVNEPVGV